MSGWAWPRIALICPEVKSRIGGRSVVVDEAPAARSMTRGVKRAAVADQEAVRLVPERRVHRHSLSAYAVAAGQTGPAQVPSWGARKGQDKHTKPGNRSLVTYGRPTVASCSTLDDSRSCARSWRPARSTAPRGTSATRPRRSASTCPRSRARRDWSCSRSRSGIVATDAARHLADQAQSLLADFGRLERVVTDLRGGQGQHLAVACFRFRCRAVDPAVCAPSTTSSPTSPSRSV